MAELRTVTALGEGSTPFDPPKRKLGTSQEQEAAGRSGAGGQFEIRNSKFEILFTELWPRGEVLGRQPRR